MRILIEAVCFSYQNFIVEILTTFVSTSILRAISFQISAEIVWGFCSDYYTNKHSRSIYKLSNITIDTIVDVIVIVTMVIIILTSMLGDYEAVS